MVILSHSCDAFVGTFDNSFTFHQGVFWGSMARACVPLFAMMSGILLFPIQSDLSTFYKKRFGRILKPFLFWSILSPILFYLYLNFVKSSNSALIDMKQYTLTATFEKIANSIFNFNYDTTPLWYVYMLIGLYLIIPIIGVWLEQASKKDLQLFLSFWIVSLFIPYIKMIAPLLGYTGNWGNNGIWGVCNWNEFGTFYYFSGFLGYIILAYYLLKYPINWSFKKTIAIAIPIFIIGFIITFWGFLAVQKNTPGNFVNLEMIWYFCNINVAMMTFTIFIIIQKAGVKASKWIKDLSTVTFGIFLCHFVITQAISDIFLNIDDIPTSVKIWIIAILTAISSYLVVKLLACTKLTKQFVY